MITVNETVFKDDGTVEYETSREWKLKFRFLNEFKKIKGVSSWVIADLSEKNEAIFEIDGVKRKITIDPHIYLGNEEP